MKARQADPAVGRAEQDSARALRIFLSLDATASVTLGVLLAALGAMVLAELLGYPPALLIPVGVGLVVFAGWLRYLATRPFVSRAGAGVVVVGNVLWVLTSVVLVLAGWFDPTTLGRGFVLVQAAAVAVFAALQYGGLRRAGSALR
jgi:hypothetical protein